LKPGPAQRADPGPEPGRVKEKMKEGKTWYDPATRLTRQDPASNPLTFFFVFLLLKRRRFDFFKKNKIDPADPAIRSRPIDQIKT